MIHYSISSRKKLFKLLMSKLFENEKSIALGEDFHQAGKKKAVKLPNPGIARKRSMLPKGNSANTSKITYCRKCLNTKICVCFRV